MKILQNYGSRSEGGVRLRSRPIQKPLPASKLAGFEKVTVDRDLLGFEFRRGRGAARIKSGWMVGVPYWCFALATGAGPTLRLRALMRRRRRGRAGLCVACGYDLRATPGRCPECGASPSVSDG